MKSIESKLNSIQSRLKVNWNQLKSIIFLIPHYCVPGPLKFSTLLCTLNLFAGEGGAPYTNQYHTLYMTHRSQGAGYFPKNGFPHRNDIHLQWQGLIFVERKQPLLWTCDRNGPKRPCCVPVRYVELMRDAMDSN